MNREKVLLGLMGLLAVYALIYYTGFNPFSKEEVFQESVEEENAVLKVLAIRKIIPTTPSVSLASAFDWDKDLFSATLEIQAEDIQKQKYILTGIESSSSPSAIIDGEPVRIGYRVGEYEVIDIARNQVVLYGNQKRLVLVLNEEPESVSLNQDEFDRVFREARLNGLRTFEFKGRIYNTRLKSEMEKF